MSCHKLTDWLWSQPSPPCQWGFETVSGLRWSGRENEHQITRASLENDIKI